MENKPLTIQSDSVRIVKLDIPILHLANFILKLYVAWVLATLIMLPVLFIMFLIILAFIQ